jgi:predicted ATPase
MALDRIELEGYKSIQALELDLSALNILIGPNGAGKSNFISLFRLLNEMVEGRFQLAVARGGGAEAFLHFGRRVTPDITVHLKFGQNAYRCVWEATVSDTLIFNDERVFFWGQGYSKPWWDALGSGHEESRLPKAARDARGKVAGYVLNNLRTWRLYHFHDTSDAAGVKRIGDINDNLYLRTDASNLAAFLYRLQTGEERHYRRIVEIVRQVAPFFDDFSLRPSAENATKIQLEWQEKGSDRPFLAHYLSDGTLRFICLATVLLQPNPPSTILVDEPELGLHPYALSVLAGLMKSAARRTQLIASTQSVALIDHFSAEDLLIVDRLERATTIRRVDAARLTEWLDEYSLSELWEKNVLGGRP